MKTTLLIMAAVSVAVLEQAINSWNWWMLPIISLWTTQSMILLRLVSMNILYRLNLEFSGCTGRRL